MDQLGLFSYAPQPRISKIVDPDGPVHQGDPDICHILPHPRLVWHRAEIEVHQHDDGSWMWAVSYQMSQSGSCYAVGPKWGRFAASPSDALYYAIEELRKRLDRRVDNAEQKDRREILAWCDDLSAELALA